MIIIVTGSRDWTDKRARLVAQLSQRRCAVKRVVGGRCDAQPTGNYTGGCNLKIQVDVSTKLAAHQIPFPQPPQCA